MTKRQKRQDDWEAAAQRRLDEEERLRSMEYAKGVQYAPDDTVSWLSQASWHPQTVDDLRLLCLDQNKCVSHATVRSAYRRLALLAHPDRIGGSVLRFTELKNAYDRVMAQL